MSHKALRLPRSTSLRLIVLTAGIAAVLALSLLAVRNFHSRAWERFLRGPFQGQKFDGAVELPPASQIPLPGDQALEVHQHDGSEWPILALRSANGRVEWAYVLRPELRLTDGSVQNPYVRAVQLVSIRRSPAGFKVIFRCRWGRGGDEKGIIYLSSDLLFKGFSLAW